MTERTCCVTGHREIQNDKIGFVKDALEKEVRLAVGDGYTRFISGFAEGVDLLFAEIVVSLKSENSEIALEAAIPYRNRVKNRDSLFRRLLSECSCVAILGEEYSPSCYINRNRYMVQSSERVIAVYDERDKGGTLFTLRYAHTLEKDVRLIEI